METSPTIAKIAKALLEAQKEMVNAVKDSKNPFFKSTYADLNSVREACMPALNKHGISAIQPTVFKDGKNFINTILIHESGEFISGLTEIVYSKQNDAQSQGSGITYARRYGIQSICNIGVEDDDGNKASNPQGEAKTTTPPKAQTPPPANTTLEVSEELKNISEKVQQFKTVLALETYWKQDLTDTQRKNTIVQNIVSKRKLTLETKA